MNALRSNSKFLWLMCAALAVTPWTGQLRADGLDGRFEVRSADLDLKDGVYHLNARIDLPVNDAVRRGLAEGVPLTVELHLDIERVRQLLPNSRVAELTQRYHLQYNAVSARYILRNDNSGQQESLGTVDAAIDELQGEVVDHQDGRDGQGAENRHRARLQARPWGMPAEVAHQVRELAGEQHEQREQPADIDQQNPRQPAVELGRILRGRREQIQRGQPQCNSYRAEHRGAVLADHGCSVHVYQSLSRCQSLTQNISTRRLNGTVP